MTVVKIGDRIDVFEIIKDPYKEFNIGGHYAEVANGKFKGNGWGRNMVSNNTPPLGMEGWHMNTPENMKKVGTMVITKIK